MKKKNLDFSILSFLMLVFVANSTFGQENVVKGIVIDQENRPLKNVIIVFHDPNKGIKFTIKSDKEGNFIKVGIPPSLYKVSAEHEGYSPLNSEILVRLGTENKLNIRLDKIPLKFEEDTDFVAGIKLFSQGKYKDAIEYFEKVITKFPDNIIVFYNLGLSYLRNEEIDSAIASLVKVIEIRSDFIEAYFALGECYFKKGEKDKAINTFMNTLEYQPNNPKTYFNIGIIYSKYDMTNDAVSFFKKSIELDTKFSSAYYQAGLSYIKSGDFKKGINLFEDFLRLEPNAPEAPQVKSMIEELRKQIDKKH